MLSSIHFIRVLPRAPSYSALWCHQSRAQKDQQTANPLRRADGFVQKHLAEQRRQHVSDGRHRQHKTQVGQAEQRQPRQHRQDQHGDAQRHEWIQHRAQIHRRIQRQYLRKMFGAPGHGQIAQRPEQHKKTQ